MIGENCQSPISSFFTTAAFRIGHSQSTASIPRLDAEGNEIENGNLSIREAFFTSQPIVEDGIDPILRGIIHQTAEEIDTKVVDELRNFLFGPPGSGGMDLVSMGIQRGRDLGLPSYIRARIDYGLAPVTSFEEITSDVEVQEALEVVYGDVENIDPWVGGLAEDHVEGGIVGELFRTVIADQFQRSRDGDAKWYENGQFTESELSLIRGTSLSQLIERNTDIEGLPDNVFTQGTVPQSPAAAGTAATESATEFASFDGSGNNPKNPQLGAVGENLKVDHTVGYSDGISEPGGLDRPPAREVSNGIFDQSESIPNQAGATALSFFWGQLLTHDIVRTPIGISNTLKIHADQLEGENTYPFIAEKLPLLLNHNIYEGVDNVIDRPIYLPALDTENAVAINPDADTTVTTGKIPGAAVFVEAGTLENQQGQTFTGKLSITEVPRDLT